MATRHAEVDHGLAVHEFRVLLGFADGDVLSVGWVARAIEDESVHERISFAVRCRIRG